MDALTQRSDLATVRATIITVGGVALAALLILSLPMLASTEAPVSKPTVVLANSAFAE